jgi:hypothetical protein
MATSRPPSPILKVMKLMGIQLELHWILFITWRREARPSDPCIRLGSTGDKLPRCSVLSQSLLIDRPTLDRPFSLFVSFISGNFAALARCLTSRCTRSGPCSGSHQSRTALMPACCSALDGYVWESLHDAVPPTHAFGCPKAFFV